MAPLCPSRRPTRLVDRAPRRLAPHVFRNQRIVSAAARAGTAVIGPDWLNAREDDGNRRLDSPNDFVRIEIAAALRRDIPVIPILLDNSRMPRADQLPDDLKELALRQGVDVCHASFHNDMEN